MSMPDIIEICIDNVNFGTNVTVIKPVNLYGCNIEDDCFIGPFVEIQKNVSVGSRTKIQSHSFICELVTVLCLSMIYFLLESQHMEIKPNGRQLLFPIMFQLAQTPQYYLSRFAAMLSLVLDR